jgi:hypothetical protein
MPEKCPVCGQRTELEIGFYYGTGYVSYALTIGFSIITFTLWWFLIGISVYNNSIMYWLATNITLLVLLQPWFMRTSRVIWLTLFYHKDDHLHQA